MVVTRNRAIQRFVYVKGHAAVPGPRSAVRGRHGVHGGGDRSANRERREDGEPAPGDGRLRRVQGEEGQRGPLPDVPRVRARPRGVPDRDGGCSPRLEGGPGERRVTTAVLCFCVTGSTW